jgi:hypothetical protein
METDVDEEDYLSASKSKQASKQEEESETSGRRPKREKATEEDADIQLFDPHDPRNNNIHTLYFHENDDPDETEDKSLGK